MNETQIEQERVNLAVFRERLGMRDPGECEQFTGLCAIVVPHKQTTQLCLQYQGTVRVECTFNGTHRHYRITNTEKQKQKKFEMNIETASELELERVDSTCFLGKGTEFKPYLCASLDSEAHGKKQELRLYLFSQRA